MGLLLTTVRDLRTDGWQPGNVDVTIVAARPRIDAHRGAMRAALAEVLGLPAGAVSVKATTTDGLGSLGRSEGIAAWAVCAITGG
jgi:2-C-methyl-D-erythritol 2,4-cyclodiphosphate synthase